LDSKISSASGKQSQARRNLNLYTSTQSHSRNINGDINGVAFPQPSTIESKLENTPAEMMDDQKLFSTSNAFHAEKFNNKSRLIDDKNISQQLN